MKCAKCGAEIRPGCVYCSNCGQEAQIVTEINILEDDLLRSMLEEEDQQKTMDSGNETASMEKKNPERQAVKLPKTGEAEPKKERTQESKKKKKKNRKILVILLCVLAAACVAVFGLVQYEHQNSASYQLKKANEALSQKNYTSALSYVNHALQLDADNQEAMLLQGQIYVQMKDTDQAETVFLQVIDQDPSCADAYQNLLELYDSMDSYDQILALKEKASDQKILALFDDYLVEAPVISPEGGNYNEFPEVTLSVKGKGLEIYYTMDGSTPTSDDTLYEDAITFEEQGKITLTAVAMDKEGHYSEPVSAKYIIELDAPDAPSVSPDGGIFRQASTVTVRVPRGTTVYYTWGDTTPTRNSARYTGPIDIPEGNNILSLVAIDENGMSSQVLKCNYIYYPETQAEPTVQENTEVIE